MAMSIPNPELQLAHDFVQQTNCNIFLTGKAGTGKTTFLHNLKGNTHKRMIVTAPTGVAAINAGGVTLHSFFQMPWVDARQVSLDMFNTGLTIAQVAKERGLVNSTIEEHLAFFVEAGRLDIGKLLSDEKKRAIERKLAEMKDKSLGEIKNALGDDCSYGEIKIVQAHRKYLEDNGLLKHLD